MMKITIYFALSILMWGQATGAPRKPVTRKHSMLRPEQRFVPGSYIVELSGEAAMASVTRTVAGQPRYVTDRTALLSQHRARVAREQALLHPLLVATGAQVAHSVDLVMNAMMVKYGGKREDLEALPGVKRVYPVRRMKQNLDRAISLAQVNDVWNRIGGSSNAGAGIKIGILDQGIDIVHPGFKDTGFQAPAGYPKTDTAADLKFTNNKVIVARSYASMISLAVFGSVDPDPTVQDHSGHGTALAMVSAGVTNSGPYGTITGVAPGAYLGIYRIWSTLKDGNGDEQTTEAADIAAINDAVADGMDVISLSFGSIYAPRFDQDPLVAALEAAYQAGTMVVVSAGNDGPYFTSVGSPGTAPHAITVGASTNDRAFGPAVWAPYLGTLGGWNISSLGLETTACLNSNFVCSWVLNGSGSAPSAPITAPAVDAATLNNPLACNAFDSRVAGKIVVASRGTCTFATKVANAQAAGAAAALIFDTKADTDTGNFIVMQVSPATLPSQSIDFYSAQYITESLAFGSLNLTMSFNLCGDSSYNTPCAFTVAPNLLTAFSSTGPGVDLSIKPEIVAPGENLSMATQRYDSSGGMYDPSGYIVADGTSFASPFAAGVAALIKAARPGLTPDQYRSLVINTAKSIVDPDGHDLSVQQSGAGLVNALSAYQSPAVASPDGLGLGISSGSPQISRTFTLTNIGPVNDTFSLSTSSVDGVLRPVLPVRSISLGAGRSAEVAVQFNGSGLAPGAYEGFVVASSAVSGAQVRVPYWLDVPGTDPADYIILGAASDFFRNQKLLDAFDFRLTDAAGAPMTNIVPRVVVIQGGGSVVAVNSADAANANVVIDSLGDVLQDIPGLWTVDVILGRASGDNVFRVTAGTLSFDVVITGCRAYDSFGQCLP